MRHKANWMTRVLTCSALEKKNLDTIHTMITEYEKSMNSTGELQKRRLQQNKEWFKNLFFELLKIKLNQNKVLVAKESELEKKVALGEIMPLKAANEYLDLTLQSLK